MGERGELFFVFMSNCESIAFINFRYVLLMKLVHKMFFFFICLCYCNSWLYFSKKEKKKKKKKKKKSKKY